MQQSRRSNPYPFTWEIPAAAGAAAALTMILGVHAARSAANLAAGDGWSFTPRQQLFSSLAGLLRGNAAAGLSHVAHPATATALWIWVGVVELLILVGLALLTKAGLNRWGPGRMRGMASREEAERLLGRTKLNRVAAIIRPDLYGKTRTR